MVRESSVSIVTRLLTGQLRYHGSLPGRIKRLSFSPRIPRRALRPTQPHCKWIMGSQSPGVKLLVYGFDHLFPSSARVKNKSGYIFAFQGMGRDNFTFTFTFHITGIKLNKKQNNTVVYYMIPTDE